MIGLSLITSDTDTAPVGFGDVWSLAKKPSEALRQLLSPEDLVKLGSALRTRTTNLFEGMFEPAPKRPKDATTEPAPPEAATPTEPVKPKVE